MKKHKFQFRVSHLVALQLLCAAWLAAYYRYVSEGGERVNHWTMLLVLMQNGAIIVGVLAFVITAVMLGWKAGTPITAVVTVTILVLCSIELGMAYTLGLPWKYGVTRGLRDSFFVVPAALAAIVLYTKWARVSLFGSSCHACVYRVAMALALLVVLGCSRLLEPHRWATNGRYHAELSESPNVDRWEFWGAAFTDDRLAAFESEMRNGKRLRVTFHYTAVSDESARLISRIPQLSFVDLRGTKVTPKGAAQIVRRRPECDVIR